MSLILATPLLIASLFVRDLYLAMICLIIGNLVVLYPLCCLQLESKNEAPLQAFISSLVLSDLLLFLAFNSLGFLDDSIQVFIILSFIFRISITASSRAFWGISSLLLFSEQSALFFSYVTYGAFIAKAFSDFFLLLLAISVPVAILVVLIGANSGLFSVVQSFLHRISTLSHRILGPILIEWLILRVPAALSVIVRLMFRFVSYSSLQRNFATAFLLFVILLAYILRL